MSCSKGPTLWRDKTDWSQISPTRPAQSLCYFATLQLYWRKKRTSSVLLQCSRAIQRVYWVLNKHPRNGSSWAVEILLAVPPRNLPHTLKQAEKKEPAGSKTVLFITNVRTNNEQSPPLLETTRPRASIKSLSEYLAILSSSKISKVPFWFSITIQFELQSGKWYFPGPCNLKKQNFPWPDGVIQYEVRLMRPWQRHKDSVPSQPHSNLRSYSAAQCSLMLLG